jgi:hypothetical protein
MVLVGITCKEDNMSRFVQTCSALASAPTLRPQSTAAPVERRRAYPRMNLNTIDIDSFRVDRLHSVSVCLLDCACFVHSVVDDEWHQHANRVVVSLHSEC